MTREIKFRAWDKDGQVMITQENYNPYKYFFYFDNFGKIKVMWIGDDEETEVDFELMQFTGLKDKNGKEIYEGDIVRYVYNQHDWKTTVEFDDGGWCLVKSGWRYELANNSKNYCEVIGNIYENKELLK